MAVPRPEFQTSDYAEAGEYLSGVYGADCRLTGRRRGFLLNLVRLGAGEFTVDQTTQTDDVAVTMAPVTTLMLVRTVTSTIDFRFDGTGERFGPDEVLLAAKTEAGDPIRVRSCAGVSQIVCVPFPLLGQVAATAATHRPAPIRFTTRSPANRAGARHVVATLDYLVAGMRERPDAMAEPLVAGAAARLLGAVVLNAFPSNVVTDPAAADRRDAHPATVRRAKAFADDNAHLDIGVADMAAAANVTVRALQYAFRRHCGTTPMGYLRTVRLHRAHHDLLTADPASGVTVTQVAARWGFFHPGRFARLYRECFGVPPYRTLLRAGG